jgi:hypothetical protein
MSQFPDIHHPKQLFTHVSTLEHEQGFGNTSVQQGTS